MNTNDLIFLLEKLNKEERLKPIMLEIEHEIYLNLQMVRYQAGKFVVLSVFPDPFEEALKKAGVR